LNLDSETSRELYRTVAEVIAQVVIAQVVIAQVWRSWSRVA
jgi:hypothetical protein